MLNGILNIVIGAILIIAAQSGYFIMRGTQSAIGLVVIGALLIAYGLYQMIPKKKE